MSKQIVSVILYSAKVNCVDLKKQKSALIPLIYILLVTPVD